VGRPIHGHSYINCAERLQFLTYRTWVNIHQRCENPKQPAYKWYGAKGVKVCERWGKFENFLADMGLKIPGITIDRIDSYGDYSPANCRWLSNVDQQRNRRRHVLMTYLGETLQAAEWARRLNIHQSTLLKRIKAGWSVEKALSTPSRRLARAA
jgi:hypothetical protein